MFPSMDPVFEIKARLPIDELVGQYCALQKKGKHFQCLCPFHNDTHPSMLVSPDKGIAFCFACNNGGDIFSFYQKIEGVDFRQALIDLGEKTGVDVKDVQVDAVKKDEKERLRECLETVQKFYERNFKQSPAAMKYLQERCIPQDQVKQFGLGYAPDSFSQTYEHLLKEGFSKSEIMKAGLGIQKDLKEGKIYDRFRNRIMFPIHDHQGRLVAFGGRTLGEGDAKYINSAEGPLYRKSSVLYGFHHAKEAMRPVKKVIVVEGYFDLLACHRVGVSNVVAACGTAFTQEHAKLLKRHTETVVLCLDQDTAGRTAAERAFHLCSAEGLNVQTVVIPDKDPDETAVKDPGLLTKILQERDVPYVEHVLRQLEGQDLSSVQGKRTMLKTVLPLIDSIPSAVEKSHYLLKVAGLLGTTEIALREDLANLPKQMWVAEPAPEEAPSEGDASRRKSFSSMEVSLALFLLYPGNRHLLDQLIAPEEGMEEVLYQAIKQVPEEQSLTPDMLTIPEEYRERLSILLLYCEDHDMANWSEGLSVQEIRKNCKNANHEFLQRKQRDIAKQLMQARAEGRPHDEAQLTTQYQQVLKLAKMAL
ncbi:DNA primase [Candidatus Peregrinibacteria bacterium CG10_big_fil_rev_8_21_14_0_10_54_7]|nr:MAG: DNA primase [Candidatus Peregrinibacteria bacterium CG10_big_fil_rev_8_21_14_0_10_54_7]